MGELATINPDEVRELTRADREMLHESLLERADSLTDDELALLEALELAGDTDSVTRFPKAEIIHQGTPAITIAGELFRKVEAVVLAQAPRRGLFGSESNRPLCSSIDGYAPVEQGVLIDVAGHGPIPTGPSCAQCQFNAWGSAAWWKGQEDSGSKACTEKRLLGLLVKGRDISVLLFVPPTSLRQWELHVANMRLRKAALVGTYTEIRVEQEQAGERQWGVLKFEAGPPVDQADKRTVFGLKRALLGTLEQTTIQADPEVSEHVDQADYEAQLAGEEDVPPPNDEGAPPEG